MRKYSSRRNLVLRRSLTHPRRHVKLRHYSGEQYNEATSVQTQDCNSPHVVVRSSALEEVTN